MTSIYDAAKATIGEITPRYEIGGVDVIGVETGFELLDYTSGGYRKDNMYAFAARPGGGKTAFVLSSAIAMATKGASVAFFNLEMSNGLMALRLLSSMTGIHALALERGRFSASQLELLQESAEKLKNLNIQFYDSGLHSWELRSTLEEHKKSNHLDVCIVDYLSLFRDPITNGTYERMTNISLKVREAAHDFDIPMIAIAQMNRAIESRESAEPQLSDLRDSGQVEQDASLVGFVHRPDMYNYLNDGSTTAPDVEDAYIIVRKNRHGQVGSIPLWFHPKLMKWTDRKEDVEEPKRRRKHE
jgi:replicative DNA helicase